MSTPRTNAPSYYAVPESPNAKKWRSRLAFSILGLGLAALAAVVELRSHELLRPVHTAPVITEPSLPPVVAAIGEMQPLREVKISPEVSGEIIELPVKEGQQVKKGDLLMRIKPDFYVANRDQAEGSCKSALANVDLASARLEEAKAELKRYQDLYRRKLVSASAFEQAKVAYDIAKAQLSSAEGQVETARACLARAQYDLDKTTILSPITGTVAKLNSAVGERVVGTATMAGTEVMTLADLNDMEARVVVGEKDIGLIGCGQKAQLELNAFPGHTFEGTVLEIATSCDGYGLPGPGGNRRPAKFEVTIHLQDKRVFRPGMSVLARIQTLSGTPAATVKSVNDKAHGHHLTS